MLCINTLADQIIYLNHPESKMVSIFVKLFMIWRKIVNDKIVDSISKVCQPAEKKKMPLSLLESTKDLLNDTLNNYHRIC